MPAPLQLWMPGAVKDDRGGTGAPLGEGPTVVVVHTTESDGPAYYDGTEPHIEVGLTSLRQFAALDVCSKALWNEPGGVQTNRRPGHVIQIEVIWRAAKPMPDALLRRLALVIAFIKRSLPDLVLAGPSQGFHGSDSAGVNAPWRFTYAKWNAFAGICGHQHVPENDHWDPGTLDIAKLIRFVHEELGTTPDVPPTQEKKFVPGTSVLTFAHSGLVLDVAGRSTEDGAPLVQWPLTGAANQLVRFEPADQGWSKVVFEHSGKVLDFDPNAKVLHQWTRTVGNANQLWKPEQVNGRIITLRSVHGVVVDLPGLDLTPGARVATWTPNGGPNQLLIQTAV